MATDNDSVMYWILANPVNLTELAALAYNRVWESESICPSLKIPLTPQMSFEMACALFLLEFSGLTCSLQIITFRFCVTKN